MLEDKDHMHKKVLIWVRFQDKVQGREGKQADVRVPTLGEVGLGT